MPLLRRFLLLLALLVSAPALAAGDPNWFYRGSDIAPDPAWTFGTLPNGVRYAVRHNRLPEGQVSVRVRIDAGSLHEEANERGWAHFVEHMAFRGTKSFADGEARETWAELGASFGSDTNATTQPTQTVYMLDLPKADRASIDRSLAILSEMVDVAAFDPKLVETEKGVVLSELNRRAELAAKLREITLPLVFAGLKLAERDTIGTEATLKAADAAGLKAFYERWYRPERATVVMVGDADPKLMEALIAARFGGWRASGPAPAEPDYGRIAEPASPIATLDHRGSPHVASLAWVRPWRDVPDTKANEREDLARLLAERILNRRFEAKARGEAAYLSASVNAENSRNVADTTQVSVMAKEGRWQAALAEAYAIVADALRAPPSEAEIAREIQNLRTSAKAYLESEPTRRSPQHAQRLISAIDSHDVVTSGAAQLALLEELAPTVTPAAVDAAMKTMFSGAGPRMVMLSPAPLAGLAEALAAARAAAPAERRADRKVSMDDLPALGAAGRELSRERIADLDAWIVRFDNGSSLVFKRTDFEKGQVGVTLRFGTGLAGLPADRKPLTWLASVLGSSGVGPFDLDGLERLLTGRRMTMSFAVAEEALVLRGSTTAPELGDQLRLLATKIVHPHFDATLFERAKRSAIENYALAFASASARAGREFGGFSHGGDKRWQPVTKPEIEAITAAQFEAYFRPLLAAGPIEAVIVGDVDLDTAVAAMLKTVAALPKRPSAPAPAGAGKVKPPAARQGPAVFYHNGADSQAWAGIGWTTFGGVERVAERRALSVAGNIVQVRLIDRLRDAEGATYSPSAGATYSEIFPAWGMFFAAAEIRPERAPLFFRLAREAVAELAAGPPEADEWSRAINPVIAGIERRVKTNSYWMGAMEDWSRKPELIEQTRTYLSDYKAMTPGAVQAAMAKWVADEGDWSMLVLPAKKPGGVN